MSKTETQSDALRLAVELDQRAALAVHPVVDALSTSAAATLRRLDAENKALRANAAEFLICVTDATGRLCNDKADAEAAIDACIVPDAAAKTGGAA